MFRGGRFAETLARVAALQAEVAAHDPSLAKAAMRYVLAHDAVSVLIPGMTSPEEVDMNIRYSDRADFPADLLARLPAHARGPELLPLTRQTARQIDRLRPRRIDAALAERSLISLPLGTIKWHCHHLPVGLDALTAQALCLAAAERTGGLVWPALYHGTGSGHGAFPWTVMMPTAHAIGALLHFTLRRLSDLGVAKVVLFSGHLADEQLAMIDALAADWNRMRQAPTLRALSVNRADIPGFPPDHAGLFETTLLQGIDPGLGDVAQLGTGADDRDRFDTASVLWGVVGADPRKHPSLSGRALVDRMARWLADRLA